MDIPGILGQENVRKYAKWVVVAGGACDVMPDGMAIADRAQSNTDAGL